MALSWIDISVTPAYFSHGYVSRKCREKGKLGKSASVAFATSSSSSERRDACDRGCVFKKVNKPWNIARSRRSERARVALLSITETVTALRGIKSATYLAKTLALDTSKGTTTFDYIPSVPSKKDSTRFGTWAFFLFHTLRFENFVLRITLQRWLAYRTDFSCRN